jgi:PPOX class probable F420-dependent enzyme
MPAMSAAEARRRLASARVAVLATVEAGGRPQLVPVTFALAGDAVVTAVDHKPKRTPRLKRLANIAADPAVCLLVHAYGEEWDRLWWVRAEGDARIVHEGPDFRSAIAALVRKYPQYRAQPPAGPVIEIAVRRWLGWAASG